MPRFGKASGQKLATQPSSSGATKCSTVTKAVACAGTFLAGSRSPSPGAIPSSSFAEPGMFTKVVLLTATIQGALRYARQQAFQHITSYLPVIGWRSGLSRLD